MKNPKARICQQHSPWTAYTACSPPLISGFAFHIKFMMLAGIGGNISKSFEILIVLVQNNFLLVMVNFLSL